MTAAQTRFVRLLGNVEAAWRRHDQHGPGRNGESSARTRAWRTSQLSELARLDDVCDLLDRDDSLAARWNRLERRAAGLPL